MNLTFLVFGVAHFAASSHLIKVHINNTCWLLFCRFYALFISSNVTDSVISYRFIYINSDTVYVKISKIGYNAQMEVETKAVLSNKLINKVHFNLYILRLSS